jgi:SAM-dependent methyltransferase
MLLYEASLARNYDLLFSNKSYQDEIDFILSRSNARGGLLDIGCGTLAHTLGLASEFTFVLAVDESPHMIEVAHRKILQNNIPNIELRVGSFEDLEVKEKFDTVIAMFNVINHILSLEELLSFFGAVASSLNSDGIFIFDVWNGSACRKIEPNATKETAFLYRDKQVSISSKTRTDLMSGKSELFTSAEILDPNSQETEVIDYQLDHRLWTPDIIRDLGDIYNFEVQEMLATKGYKNGPTISDYNLTFVMRKK